MSSTDGQLRRRFERTIRHLDHWGDVEAHDRGADRGHRTFEYELLVPGGDVQPEARALYREYHRREGRGGWQLAKYTYEYLDPVRSWRFGYHLHPVDGRLPVAHAHCDRMVDIATDEPAEHFRATEYDLREANAVFMRLYAAGRAPDCDELLPLEIQRG